MSTDAGRAVLLASAEDEDLGHLCDRVLVFRDGRVVKELQGAAVTPEHIVEETYRTTQERVVGDSRPGEEPRC